MAFRHLTLASMLALACWACGGDELGDPTGSTCPPGSTLTYETFGRAFFQTNCLSCHGAGRPESPKLDTLDQIKANKVNIDRAAAAGPDAVNTFMPEDGSVPESERRKLGEWLACDAPP